MGGTKYRKLRPIAAGGMATVFIGKSVGVGDFERVVAIKEMHPHISQETEYVNMFMDEARLAARIRHPNVVAVLDVQAPTSGPYIVMEYIEGPTLAMVLRAARERDIVMPLTVTLRIICDMLAGLHAAHELVDNDEQPLNLVHRDISPQNIMVGVDGIARITDFGVARARVRLATTRSGQLKGKLGYLPPEQVEGEHMDRRTDIYAAGVILWEALVGKRLFEAGTEAALMMKLLRGAGQSPRSLDSEIPRAIDEACMHALALAIDERPDTAEALARELERAAAASGVSIGTSRDVASFVADLEIELPAIASVPGVDQPMLGETPDDPEPDETNDMTGADVDGSPTSARPSRPDAGLASSLVVSPRRGGAQWMLAVGLLALCAAIIIVITNSANAPASTDPDRLDGIADGKPASGEPKTGAVGSPADSGPGDASKPSVAGDPSSSDRPGMQPSARGSAAQSAPDPSAARSSKPAPKPRSEQAGNPAGSAAPPPPPPTPIPTPTKPEYDPTTL